MPRHTLMRKPGSPITGTTVGEINEEGQVNEPLTQARTAVVEEAGRTGSTGGIERGLTERFVNLLQTPHELETNFTGDINTSNGVFQTSQVQPVRQRSVTYLPMEIKLIPPTIPINLQAVNRYNQTLQQAFLADGIGEALTTSDLLLDQALDYQLIFDTIEQTEPLVFYINPSDLTRQYARRVSEQFGGGMHIIEHWGEEQDRLTANGKIGGTYTSSNGLTRFFRRNTASFQQLMHLYLIYRNNGYIYEVLDTRRISLVGAVQITYDTEVWIGSFDSFSMTENADNPYTMEYSFEFTAREYYNDESLSTASTF